MNKFTKLILTSAIISTSGFAATDSYVSGNFVVNGTVNQNKDADVTGVISVNEGGVFNNKATLSFKSDGGLAISVQRSSTLADYQEANATYSLGVIHVGQYPAGSIIGVCDGYSAVSIDELDYSQWDKNTYNYTDDYKNIVAKSKVAFESLPENLPQKGTYYSSMEMPCKGSVAWTYDSSLDTYAAGAISGKITTDSGWYTLGQAEFNNELGWENWEYEENTSGDDEHVIVTNKVELSKTEVESLPELINWSYPEPYPMDVDLEWRSTPQSEESFIEQVKAAITSSAAPDDVKETLMNRSTTAKGTFDNETGTLNFVEATSSRFSGEVQNGTVKLRDTTSATLTSLKVTNVTAEYEYASSDIYSAPSVKERYITIDHSLGKDSAQAKAECESRFAPESTIVTFNGMPYGDEDADERLTFPEILTDTTLNSNDNKLKTSEMQMIVKDYDAVAGLSVDKTINIQFEGSDALKFATGKIVDSDQVIEFSGSQSAFTGKASFAEGITRVVASGDNALPVNLASDMSAINLEISGENAIDNAGSTTIKNLKVNSGATLTVAAGTTLNIGSNE